MKKKIGILTSGGDAPGMNDAIVAAIRSGYKAGFEMYVIYDGYKGLYEGNIQKVDRDFAKDKISRGGTCIKTARLPEFTNIEVRRVAVKNLREHGIDALIVIGGDGSYQGALALTKMGINCIGLPGTIDNDIASSEYSIGFDTALNTVIKCIDQIADTSSSHHRCAVVQIMGNKCGDLTLFAGLACYADIILTRDHTMSEDEIVTILKEKKKKNQDYALVCVAEKFMDAIELTKVIQENTGWDTRFSLLGALQRGGEPTAMERVRAIEMADYAIKLLQLNIGGVCVGVKNDQPVFYPIEKALEMENNKHEEMYVIHDDIF